MTTSAPATAIREIVLCDLDGTLCNDVWRLHRMPEAGNKNPAAWDAYHEGITFDKPIESTLSTITKLMDIGTLIYFVTARPGSQRVASDTKAWLKSHFSRHARGKHYGLLLRPHGDVRRSVDLKKAMLEAIRKDHPNDKITAAYDDRHDVCDMYFDNGVKLVCRVARTADDGGESKFTTSLLQAAGVAARNVERAQGSVSFDWKEAAIDGMVVHPAATEMANHDIREQLREENAEPAQEGRPLTRREAVDVPKVAVKGVEGDVVQVLADAMETLKSRKAVYGKADAQTGAILAILFPDGITVKTAEDHRVFHFLNHAVGKMVRFANSGLQHADSAHDLAAYSAFMQTLAGVHSIKVNNGQ